MLPDIFGGLDELSRLLLSVTFIVLAIIVSRWQQADLERDLAISTIRGFIQLILIGYILELIFAQDNPFFTVAILVLMTVIAARTSAARAKKTPRANRIALLSIGVGSALTMGVLIVLGVFEFVPRDVIPIGGMVVGNAMTAASLVMTRLPDDLAANRLAIEAKLALGANSRESSLLEFRQAIRGAMVPIIDTTKTVGLIKLPGAMTGMILAGASPLEAVRLQIIVMYLLTGATTFTALIAAYLTYREYFTPAHQLKLAQSGSS